jgi:cell division protein FtsW
VLLIGSRAGGAVRWFKLGPLSFQPSELAKFALVLYLGGAAGAQGGQGPATSRWGSCRRC